MIMMPLMPHPKYLSSFLHFPFLFSLMLLSVLLSPLLLLSLSSLAGC